MSIPPKLRQVFSIAFWIASELFISQTTERALSLLNSFSASFKFFSEMSNKITTAPSATNFFAIDFPIPPPAPVTRAIFLDNGFSYYQQCKKDNSPVMRDPNPVILLYPGIGLFSFAKNKQTARVASEFYTNPTICLLL